MKHLLNRFQPIQHSMIEKVQLLFQQAFEKPISLWHRLVVAERLYLVALFFVFVSSDTYFISGFITVFALVIEFWPVFNRMWHALAGKAVILLFYAVIANFALVSASGVVNEVVTVDASALTYTHNFAVLLHLPVWLFTITALALVLMQLSTPFYWLLLLLLRPFGMKRVQLIARSEFPFSMSILRFSMTFVLLTHLFLVLSTGSSESLDVDKLVEQAVEKTAERIAEGEPSHEAAIALQEELDKINQTEPTPGKTETAVADVADTEPEGAEEEPSLLEQYIGLSKRMIAEFAFHLEANSYSRCEIASGASIVELNDYEILQITPDETQTYGHRFEVKNCISPAFPIGQ
ncbi:hypothetical protein [Shewanella gelidii]|uniref:Uncharacterized protein n=1 Tax=Shewanella gelidii TaxID=1642821 RepID=A0A917JMR6_9GAMM|nr:hypothetical protein [Shewanella gelidii]MCL1097272.1 hypothetical protein [Shewanella gelidii]GGI73836.1 hypothetical protein GCM10009332_09160 [Shewanella gelidii]